ncbi:putative zinc-containing alcohol dehydrogenase [Dactylonectria macrodidyma]|uniref:Zinc-containing alcohol dehydrogenase n=1 Tax=Dactylonectria macrodidyma TaxID=307937 RepID=A0A9P9DPW0_9HYPO|nr:putative zinc-containing alcohol dehydrogenase [Dactylonectria macrodidyma]
MKAIQITGEKDSPKTGLAETLSKPIPEGHDILIKVFAAGITADEITWPELYATSSNVPGHDISGVIEAFGPSYNGPLSIGDGVFAMLRADASQGGQAEFVTATPDEVALKPTSVSHAEAAALPIPILTAWEAIFTHAKVKRGAKVLVTGASGAVGIMLVQLASRMLEAEVIGLASPKNHARLKDLGASHVIDYNSSYWPEMVKGVDAVFDTVGGAILDAAWNTVKDDGVIVTVADPPPPWAFGRGKPRQLQGHPNVSWIYFVVTASGEHLARVTNLLDEKIIEPLAVKTFPVDAAVEAWTYAGQRGRDGKAVIEFVFQDSDSQ